MSVQLNVRIPEAYRQLLKLLVYLDDTSESIVVCSGLLLYAHQVQATNMASADGLLDPSQPEVQLLMKVLSRCERA